MDYIRKCPRCDQSKIYANKYSFLNAQKNTSLCFKCCNKGRVVSEYTRKKISENHANIYGKNNPMYGKTHSVKAKRLISDKRVGGEYSIGKNNPMYGKTHTDETKEKMRLKAIGRPSPHKGAIVTENTRRKLRISRLNDINKKCGLSVPNYNKKACRFFDRLNEFTGWKGVHAEDGGEYIIDDFGYRVDYYEPTLNLIIEWDEKYHKYQQEKDLKRQNEIIAMLHCNYFIRVQEETAIKDIEQAIKYVSTIVTEI